MGNVQRRALAGVVSAGVILGVAELVSAPIASNSSPLIAVGDEVVKRTPLGVERWAIENFGTADKMVLFTVMLSVSVVVACAAGMLERRTRPWGSALFVAFGIVGAAAALTRTDSSWTYAVPSVLGVGVGIGVLRWLLRPILETTPDEPHTATAGSTRREFTGMLVGAGAFGLLAWLGGRVWASGSRDVSANRANVKLPAPAAALPPVPMSTDLQVPGITKYITANPDFYRIDTALVVPQLSTDDWSLRIHGMVDREIRINFAQLTARQPIERLVTLACVSNPIGGDLIGNAKWLGFPIKDLLEEAGVDADADMVLSTSVDDFTAGTPLDVLMDGRDAMLAVGMNGEPLPIMHGFPVRMVVPGLYGYVSATKWVTDLEVTRFDRAKAYWTKRGWSARGPIKTACRIDTPRWSSELRSGPLMIAGVAWAQHRGIRAVEVQVDDGEWQQARLADEVSIDTWRQWVVESNLTEGKHTLRARATDGTGEVQTSAEADVVPDGATGYAEVVVKVK
ncbi:molybdopterin-dependent oxidoreductase [Antrihabitans stalactiti]|uniref:Oxidoreductase n=1 Tax=Antrihabitans stalactiti TaxID=2584121 RepID=A0A848KQ69_9NOCA|nr:oxidoreductase [Antrihabitans stalactiti]